MSFHYPARGSQDAYAVIYNEVTTVNDLIGFKLWKARAYERTVLWPLVAYFWIGRVSFPVSFPMFVSTNFALTLEALPCVCMNSNI